MATSVAHNGLAAVAATGTAAHTVGFEHHHLEAFLGQFNGRAQAGKAGTHNRYIGLVRAQQRRLCRRALHAGFVVAVLVELGVGAQ